MQNKDFKKQMPISNLRIFATLMNTFDISVPSISALTLNELKENYQQAFDKATELVEQSRRYKLMAENINNIIISEDIKTAPLNTSHFNGEQENCYSDKLTRPKTKLFRRSFCEYSNVSFWKREKKPENISSVDLAQIFLKIC